MLRADDAALTERLANGDGEAAEAVAADADDSGLVMQVDVALSAAKEQAAKRLRDASAAKQNPISKKAGKRGKAVRFSDPLEQ